MTTPAEHSGLRCYDRDGQPIPLEQMAMLRLDDHYATVQQDDLLTPDGQTMWISTVWLGIDHNFERGGEPVIFETMIFVRGYEDEYCARYSTAQDAQRGHDEIIDMLRRGVPLSELHLARKA